MFTVVKEVLIKVRQLCCLTLYIKSAHQITCTYFSSEINQNAINSENYENYEEIDKQKFRLERFTRKNCLETSLHLKKPA
jgi:hypothetical protein